MQVVNLNIDQLIERCKKADKSAQFELYKRYYKAMYNTAYRILNNSYEAEDIMQESFLIAYAKLGTFKAEDKLITTEKSFGAWLKRIVINKSLTQLKRDKKFSFTSLEVAEKNKIEDDLSDNFENLKVKNMTDALKKLKKSYRTAISLHFIEGYDYEEMAGILNISYENVRVVMSRAKKKLKNILHEEYQKIS